MSHSHPIRKGVMAVGALGALALGGSALANAATSNDNAAAGSAAQAQGYGAPGQGYGGPGQGRLPNGARPDPTTPGGHVGKNGKTEAALPSDVAAKVKAAARAKVPGGTIERVETDVDHGSPYEAHVRKADGTELEVLIDKDFQVTAVNTMQGR
jgi:uncharacterized membrane protein YkoI